MVVCIFNRRAWAKTKRCHDKQTAKARENHFLSQSARNRTALLLNATGGYREISVLNALIQDLKKRN